MAKQKEEKTNVMRLLDQKKVPYTPHAYPHGDGEAPDGVTVARSLGLDPDRVFKTLVTKGASGGYYVFDIPVAATLDLKKAAKAVGEKSVAMLPSKELLPLTGLRREDRLSGGGQARGPDRPRRGKGGGCGRLTPHRSSVF